MIAEKQIEAYSTSQPEPKRSDMQALHTRILGVMPPGKLWFDNGKDAENRTVANPTIGYGQYTIKYADGKTRDFFQIGLSANTTGISVYIMGIRDKMYLARTFGEKIGKASITGYCIKFKKLSYINPDVLEAYHTVRAGSAPRTLNARWRAKRGEPERPSAHMLIPRSGYRRSTPAE